MSETNVVTGGGRSAVMEGVEDAVGRRVDALFPEWTRSQGNSTREQHRCSRCGARVAARPLWRADVEHFPTVEFGGAPTVGGDRPTDRPSSR